MNTAKKIDIKNEVIKFMFVWFFGFFIFFLVFYSSWRSVQVHGPLYNRIVQGKDLIADMLPPPEYIIETYLTVFQMLEESDTTKLEAYAAKCKSLKDEYESRHDFWAKDIPDGEQELKEAVVERSYQPAIDFFASIEQEYIPAILNGDKDKAKELVNGILKEQFKAHQKAIDEAIELAVERNIDDERMAKKAIKQRMVLLLNISSLMAITIIFLNVTLVRKIITNQE